jgi:hypothetical protein
VSGDTAVIGAPGEGDPGLKFGAAHVFRLDEMQTCGHLWCEKHTLLASDGAPLEDFGMSVCVSGETAVVGRRFDDHNGTDSGSVYVFDLSDTDGDGVIDASDNCPGVPNPLQDDIDADGTGDLCDPCPADPADECDLDGSGAAECCPIEGCCPVALGNAVTFCVEPGDLPECTTLSVTETIFSDPDVNILVGPSPGLGRAVALYDFEPDGLVFAAPISVTVEQDISDLPQNQRDRLDLYRYDDDAGAFRPLDAQCNVTEDPPTTFTAVCTADNVDHFSRYALIALVAWPIPAVSTWGLAVLTLIVLTAGTLIHARRRTAQT